MNYSKLHYVKNVANLNYLFLIVRRHINRCDMINHGDKSTGKQALNLGVNSWSFTIRVLKSKPHDLREYG